MIMHETETASVSSEPFSLTVFITWKGFAQGDAFRSPLRKALEFIRLHNIRYCFGDARELGVLTREDQDWFLNEWFSEAVRSGIASMAVVQPYSALARISMNAVLRFVEGVDISGFDNVALAKQWLAVQRVVKPVAEEPQLDARHESQSWGGILRYIEAVDNRKN